MNIKTFTLHLRILLFIVAVPLFSQHGDAGPDRSSCREAAVAANRTLRDNLFDAAQTQTAKYRNIEQKIMDLSERCADLASFVSGFNALWGSGPFSHVRLNEAQMSAEQTANYLDTMNVPRPGAVLKWQGDIAILIVYTMMGQNTIQQINEAYSVITERKASALIIDLRKNDGGAFAVVPLVAHLLSLDLEAGFFLSRKWTESYTGIPTPDFVQNLTPWKGWSIKSFWRDMQEKGILRIRFEPMLPRFSGPVYVLTSSRTASAAELAVDALRSSGRAVLIGEKTAGKMLSQKMYDLPEGLQIAVPIGEYFANRSGRIEGMGIAPDVTVVATSAMEKALELVRAGQGR